MKEIKIYIFALISMLFYHCANENTSTKPPKNQNIELPKKLQFGYITIKTGDILVLTNKSKKLINSLDSLGILKLKNNSQGVNISITDEGLKYLLSQEKNTEINFGKRTYYESKFKVCEYEVYEILETKKYTELSIDETKVKLKAINTTPLWDFSGFKIYKTAYIRQNY